MRKLMTTAGLAVALLAGPAYAASDAQTSTTGSDAARTGSAAAPGSATGGGSATSEGSAATSTSSGMTGSGSAASTSDTGADPARTGSAAAPGSATGGGSAETQSGTSSTTTMGSTPGTAGATATERTFTTGELHELIGQDVQNAGGEEIGEVNDVVMVDGRPVLVVGVGGFLGLGAKEVTVPYEEATMSSDGVQVNMTQDQLKQQPEYDAEATAGVSIKDTYKQ